VTLKAARFEGEKGEKVVWEEIPANLVEQAKEKRTEMIEMLADVDETIGEKFILEQEPTEEELLKAIRQATIANTFVPVMMGSAYKNKGVQLLLDRVKNCVT
jgi:elongation factor G